MRSVCGTCGYVGKNRHSVAQHRRWKGHPNLRPWCLRCRKRPRHVTSGGHLLAYCLPCDNASTLAHYHTERGKQTARQYERGYRQTDKAKQAQRRYAQSPAGRQSQHKYATSDKGKEAARRNDQESRYLGRTGGRVCGMCGYRGDLQGIAVHKARTHHWQNPTCTRCRKRLRIVRASGHRDTYCFECDQEVRQAWRDRHPGYDHEYAVSLRGKQSQYRYRHDLRGLTQVWQDPWGTTCGRCGCTIDPNEHHGTHKHNPLAESVGHEPPISYAIANGINKVLVRPEHWRCNFRWGRTMPDHERPAPPDALHIGHGCAIDRKLVAA